MDELEFRRKFEREEDCSLGINTPAINKIIQTCREKEKSHDENIRYFAENFDKIDKVYSGFTIFDTNTNGFMYQWKALNLKQDADTLVTSHEIGHILNSIKNVRMIAPEKSLKSKINIPENFEGMLDTAKANCLKPENKEEFKDYIQHLCKDSDISEAEKGPLSDIISAVFRVGGLRIDTAENICIFPSSHTIFFDNDINEDERMQKIFDEIYANIYSLKANNKENELSILRKLLGDEFMNLYDKEIEQSVQIFRNEIEKDQTIDVRKLGKETVEELEDVEYSKTTENKLKERLNEIEIDTKDEGKV